MPHISEVRRIQVEVTAQSADIVAAQSELSAWTNNWQATQSRLEGLFERLRARLA